MAFSTLKMAAASLKEAVGGIAKEGMDDIAQKGAEKYMGSAASAHMGQAVQPGSMVDDIVEKSAGTIKNGYDSKLARAARKAYIKEEMENLGTKAADEEMARLAEEGIEEGSRAWNARVETARRAGAVKGRINAKSSLNEANARGFGEEPGEGFFANAKEKANALSLDDLTNNIASKTDFSQQASRGIAGSIHGAAIGAVVGGGINAVDGDPDTGVLEGALGGAVVGGTAGFGYGYLTSKNLKVAQTVAEQGMTDQGIQARLGKQFDIYEPQPRYAEDMGQVKGQMTLFDADSQYAMMAANERKAAQTANAPIHNAGISDNEKAAISLRAQDALMDGRRIFEEPSGQMNFMAFENAGSNAEELFGLKGRVMAKKRAMYDAASRRSAATDGLYAGSSDYMKHMMNKKR